MQNESTMLNEKQELAVKAMLKGKNVFITGPGGTGKSYIIFYFIAKAMELGIKRDEIAITSTTGISASLIGGTTLHSFAGVGIADKTFEYYWMKIKDDYFKRKVWRNAKILIIDEVSMLSPRLFEMLDCLGRRIRRKNEPFGGLQLILLGDFCQLPTVKEKDFCFEAVNWDTTLDGTYYLTDIMRQTDETFQRVLNKIRVGIVDEDVRTVLNSRLGAKLKNEDGIRPTIIYSKRASVQSYNDKKEKQLKEQQGGCESHTYTCSYNYSKDLSEANKMFLKNYVDKNFRILDEIELNVGSQVMVTANFPEQGLYNGSRGIIVAFTEKKVPIVKFLDKREIPIQKYVWKYEGNNKAWIEKVQIPLMIAWAITIHKSQGMSLDFVSTNIGKSIFEFGQVYVVLSRVRSLEGLTIKDIDYNKIIANPKVIKYYEELV